MEVDAFARLFDIMVKYAAMFGFMFIVVDVDRSDADVVNIS